MLFKTRSLITLLAIVASLGLVSTANAFVWVETGDAGNLLATAQNISNIKGLIEIQGSLATTGDFEDIYAICLTGGQTFSASTISGAQFDTELFLFNSTGNGVYTNDDKVSGTFQSYLPSGHTLTPDTSGIYYLGISRYDYRPKDSSNNVIFHKNTLKPNAGYTYDIGVYGTRPGVGALTGWTARTPVGNGGDYTIFLTGTCPVPEPATMSLLGLGLVGLLGLRRKIKL